MVLFGFILFVSVAALLFVQSRSIEGDNTPSPGAIRAAFVTGQKFPAETMGLRKV
jgi:hypothetical protein